jgi:hypothetical protein
MHLMTPAPLSNLQVLNVSRGSEHMKGLWLLFTALNKLRVLNMSDRFAQPPQGVDLGNVRKLRLAGGTATEDSLKRLLSCCRGGLEAFVMYELVQTGNQARVHSSASSFL